MAGEISNAPLIIEAAITPLRIGAPAQSTQQMIAEGISCVEAGATIIHHHHDFGAEPDVATQQLIDVALGIRTKYPHTLIYPNYLKGRTLPEQFAYLDPMAQAGALGMIAFDPGFTTFGRFDENGLPSISIRAGFSYPDCDWIVRYAQKHEAPLSIGLYEPGQLRWTLAYAKAGMFPAGSMLKIYFGGDHLIDQDRVKGLSFGPFPFSDGLDLYLKMLGDVALPWIVSLQGDAILDSPIANYTLERGGHLRVGVEDAAGTTQLSNAGTVEAAVKLGRNCGREVISGADAVAYLKGQTAKQKEKV
jgi:3-keto-5-aminohexanoate cleavage enzyme